MSLIGVTCRPSGVCASTLHARSAARASAASLRETMAVVERAQWVGEGGVLCCGASCLILSPQKIVRRKFGSVPSVTSLEPHTSSIPSTRASLSLQNFIHIDRKAFQARGLMTTANTCFPINPGVADVYYLHTMANVRSRSIPTRVSRV